MPRRKNRKQFDRLCDWDISSTHACVQETKAVAPPMPQAIEQTVCSKQVGIWSTNDVLFQSLYPRPVSVTFDLSLRGSASQEAQRWSSLGDRWKSMTVHAFKKPCTSQLLVCQLVDITKMRMCMHGLETFYTALLQRKLA